MKDVFAAYGAKWIWILAGGSSASQAASYYTSNGVTFGWMTHDGDNSWRPNGFASTSMAPGVPWIGAIDAKSMEVVANNPTNIYSLAVTLASD